MTSEKKDITKPTIGDVGYATTKGLLSSIDSIASIITGNNTTTGYGGVLSEYFALLVVPPATKRLHEWIGSLENDIKSIETKVEGFTIEALSQNELFVTTLLQATQIAIRSHQQEKLEALRNAVINTALANDPKEDMQLMFLNWIDTMTPWHLNIFSMLKNIQTLNQKLRGTETEKNGITPYDLIRVAFSIDNPEKEGEFFIQLSRDLSNRGLITGYFNTQTPHNIGWYQIPEITTLGKTFLAFIESPLQDRT